MIQVGVPFLNGGVVFRRSLYSLKEKNPTGGSQLPGRTHHFRRSLPTQEVFHQPQGKEPFPGLPTDSFPPAQPKDKKPQNQRAEIFIFVSGPTGTEHRAPALRARPWRRPRAVGASERRSFGVGASLASGGVRRVPCLLRGGGRVPGARGGLGALRLPGRGLGVGRGVGRVGGVGGRGEGEG